jgi:hypothetical protein
MIKLSSFLAPDPWILLGSFNQVSAQKTSLLVYKESWMLVAGKLWAVDVVKRSMSH